MRRRQSLLIAGLLAIAVVHAAITRTSAEEKITISIGHITASDSYIIRRHVWPLRDALQNTGKVDVTLYGTGSPFSKNEASCFIAGLLPV